MDQRRRVLVTGAGSGLGRALAFRYAEAGFRVACADLRLDRAEETVRLITGFGSGAMALPVDVGDDASCEALRDAILAAWDGVDIVINNAGIACAGPLLTTPMVDWRRVIEVNLLGVVRGCHLFGRILAEQHSGHLVNIASFAGLAGAPGLAAYGSAKAAVVALSEALRAELDGSGVRVSVVCPSFFRSRLLDGLRAPDEHYRALAERLMADSRISADDVADAVFRGVARGTFLILPGRTERLAWRLKRWLPGFYFRLLMQRVRALGGV